MKTGCISDASLRLLSCLLLLAADIEHPSQLCGKDGILWCSFHKSFLAQIKLVSRFCMEQGHANATFSLQHLLFAKSNIVFLLDAGNAIRNAMALTLIFTMKCD